MKLLDIMPIVANYKYLVVDGSKSRQGYKIRHRTIYHPDVIRYTVIKTVILTVVNRKEEILESLKAYPTVERVLMPSIEMVDGDAFLKMETVG